MSVNVTNMLLSNREVFTFSNATLEGLMAAQRCYIQAKQADKIAVMALDVLKDVWHVSVYDVKAVRSIKPKTLCKRHSDKANLFGK